MGFRTGLLLGVVVGIGGSLVAAPTKGEETRGIVREALSQGGSGDATAPLRKVADSLKEQAKEALGEARRAAREAEEEMSSRYKESIND